MPKYAFVSLGSTTLVKTGGGNVTGVIASGATGGSVFLVDTLNLGATPNYPNQLSNSSNLAVLGPLGSTTGDSFATFGAHFQTGLTVSATSNLAVTVVYD